MIFPQRIHEDEMDLRIKEWEVCGYLVAGAVMLEKCQQTVHFLGIGIPRKNTRKPTKHAVSTGRWYTHQPQMVNWEYGYRRPAIDSVWVLVSTHRLPKRDLDVQARKQLFPSDRPTKRL